MRVPSLVFRGCFGATKARNDCAMLTCRRGAVDGGLAPHHRQPGPCIAIAMSHSTAYHPSSLFWLSSSSCSLATPKVTVILGLSNEAAGGRAVGASLWHLLHPCGTCCMRCMRAPGPPLTPLTPRPPPGRGRSARGPTATWFPRFRAAGTPAGRSASAWAVADGAVGAERGVKQRQREATAAWAWAASQAHPPTCEWSTNRLASAPSVRTYLRGKEGVEVR